MYVYETLDLIIFESSISYTWIIFLVAMMGLKCGFILMMSCCDMLTWPFWGSLFSIILRCILVSYWEPMHTMGCFEMFLSFSLRTDGFCDLSLIWILQFSLMPSVANRELLWSWLSFDVAHGDLMYYCGLSFWYFSSCLYRTEVTLWLWFHELRVGYLCVVSGSDLQWGPGP